MLIQSKALEGKVVVAIDVTLYKCTWETGERNWPAQGFTFSNKENVVLIYICVCVCVYIMEYYSAIKRTK